MEEFKEPCNKYYEIFHRNTTDSSYKYKNLSPFEFKNILMKLAGQSPLHVLNAGRGNPNFLETTSRSAFGLLQMYCSIIADSQSTRKNQNFGIMPNQKDLYSKLLYYLNLTRDIKSGKFLHQAIQKIKNITGFTPDKLAHNIIISTLGCFYPSPPRIQPFLEPVLKCFLEKSVFRKKLKPKTRIFTTEGATAAIIYIFNSLKYNNLVIPGDKIAILTPIYSPYLEIPNLNQYKLVQICIQATQTNNWEINPQELQKLSDPQIKALFLCNPTNPTSMSLPRKTVRKIGNIVRNKNKNLIIIVDNVYAPFADEYYSFFVELPRNTISIYSFSKYFGATGWRLGTIIINNDNIIDSELLKKESSRVKEKRYLIASTKPHLLKFIDRIVLDSREVAEGHTAGLSTPQQVMISLFAVKDIMDHKREYRKSIRKLLYTRIKLLTQPLKLSISRSVLDTNYYIILDIPQISIQLFQDKNFTNYLHKNNSPLEFLYLLAEKYSTVCLPAIGFAGPFWGIRVSIANLPTKAYPIIGQNIKLLLQQYYKKYKRNRESNLKFE